MITADVDIAIDMTGMTVTIGDMIAAMTAVTIGAIDIITK
jgi:hypothetical protein